jgi:hypothetical protein
MCAPRPDELARRSRERVVERESRAVTRRPIRSDGAAVAPGRRAGAALGAPAAFRLYPSGEMRTRRIRPRAARTGAG